MNTIFRNSRKPLHLFLEMTAIFMALAYGKPTEAQTQPQSSPQSSKNLQERIATLGSTPATIVDDIYKKQQLGMRRRQSTIDSCLSNTPIANFQNAIENGVKASIPAYKFNSNPHIDEVYGLDPEQSIPVGLISHPLCVQEKDQIAHILGTERVPDDEAIELMKKFVMDSNRDRMEALAGNNEALERFSKRWTVFMGCLAYAESLPTADAEPAHKAFAELMEEYPQMRSAFSKNGEGKPVKPEGVHFGVDRPGSYFVELRKARAEGRATPEFIAELNKKYPAWSVTGLYQFDATRPYGNTTPCVEQWNALVSRPECKIRNGNAKDYFLAFTSYGQSMNAFCGVQKIVHAFNSQANTSKPSGTDLSNIINGKLKKPQDRCVGLVARGGAGKVYAHFGPLGNSVHDNLKKLMKCVDTATQKLN
jgi:hypothetical protein